ncbi:MAG TPA: UbiA family prenyltransferase [Puia sp.]|nr:UbiA family prenyltransferase [Puia sp.]
MIKQSTIQLLRFHFSFFLMPVYWFAMSQLVHKNWYRAILIFIILHLLVYPASNGYNSYMDRDEGSIGGVKNPLQPTKQLFYLTMLMDIIAVVLSVFVSIYFLAGIAAYILASRAYSNRKIRLKKYPVIGYLTVIIFQGAVTFFLVYHGVHAEKTLSVPKEGMISSSLLIGGFYPLTQIYQHQADLKDGVKTISYLLGFMGTFLFTAILYFLSMLLLAYYFFSSMEIKEFFVLATCMLPVAVYFFMWWVKVWRNRANASFENTMRMNIIAAVCSNIAFIVVLVMNESL